MSVVRDIRQQRIFEWARAAFGDVEATNIKQRALRLLEEATEMFQACDGDEEMAHKLVTYVFSHEKGEVAQELGGIAITTLVLAAAAGLSADTAEQNEAERVLSKPVDYYTKRNAAKNAAGLKVT
jgi:NTP pyrophosphatase (non-canonical NTP hydrolase)